MAAEDGEEDVNFVGVNELRVGGFLVIDQQPYEILQLTTAKTGKHGSAKAHIVARNIFNAKRTDIILSTSAKVKIPIVTRKTYLVIGIDDTHVSLLDANGKPAGDVLLPEDDVGTTLKVLFESGQTMSITVLSALGQSKIVACAESKESN